MAEEQKRKQKRVPRKPYCRQCKERKVKCDMEQPSCKRCTRRGRCCVYDDFPPSLSIGRIRTVNEPASAPDKGTTCWTEDAASDLAHNGTSDRVAADSAVSTKDERLYSARFSACSSLHSPRREPAIFSSNTFLTSRPSSVPCFEIMYTSAFNSRIQSSSTFFARPREWVSILKLENDSLVNASVRACGALYVGHATQSFTYYCHCLNQLRRLSSAAIRDVSGVLRICIVVMFLFVYEADVPGSDVNAFLTHLNGIANLLKEVVALSAGPRTLRITAVEQAILHLLVAEFRRIECVRIALLRTSSAISTQGYDILLPEHHLYEQNWEDDRLTWLIHYLTGLAYGQPDDAKVVVLVQIETTLRNASWANEPLQMSAYSADNPFVLSETQPFGTCLYLKGSSIVDTRIKSSLHIYCDVAILRLLTTMSISTAADEVAIIQRADRCAQFILFLLTFELQGNLLWLSLALLSVLEAYSMLCPVHDDRITWSRRLLQNITGHLDSGVSRLIQAEVASIDSKGHHQERNILTRAAGD